MKPVVALAAALSLTAATAFAVPEKGKRARRRLLPSPSAERVEHGRVTRCGMGAITRIMVVAHLVESIGPMTGASTDKDRKGTHTAHH